ncbi:MAG: hypothetical protein A3C80_03060 [Candidatus Ryanbacteria bacterium RIFCSPHIGHO2_02_FULL_45_43]|uniref:Uncharacterized protein n=1 Tax=Candidatus Ryanbacteria bacterium RIFCSPHIGHO2_01_45_13 TaxID=1802112 RepID=A0A1G2FZB3_9BACT|nr:MAG: hypothetical protein A2718_04020 [Candidatus Ryanbacteria bacterium RIFCSPHIGHO2_01_FULL_44_130]OGZ43413.1 MAG: hypothetical protein A2W41_04080 [Candidatus Ryanbacteria bacterium RIFCSPHIGHO2_01_45_13]OGZ48954.1 MAG: hypothetical protein A3C80_03060 [Candidatus Ryanbacteria bacterium RIFCSPHIGHO2_02_FULL_45_43]OGZ50955.1 MAG: hypothetical protein A3E55_04330 [Candidatus Ryanbacteria bacterium RIFCSPHIGHO2_12_FULL_44_20]OGZ51560.1 MAG: hypothetical protein A3A17_01995 [Candidatus Ryanba
MLNNNGSIRAFREFLAYSLKVQILQSKIDEARPRFRRDVLHKEKASISIAQFYVQMGRVFDKRARSTSMGTAQDALSYIN